MLTAARSEALAYHLRIRLVLPDSDVLEGADLDPLQFVAAEFNRIEGAVNQEILDATATRDLLRWDAEIQTY